MRLFNKNDTFTVARYDTIGYIGFIGDKKMKTLETIMMTLIIAGVMGMTFYKTLTEMSDTQTSIYLTATK